MADTLYGRRAKLTIALPVTTPNDFSHTTTDVIEINGADDASTPGLRIQFDITRTDQKEPNTSQIVVTNLSPSTRASLQRKGVKAILDAGYEQTGMSRLFRGDVRTVDQLRNGADWDTTMKLGDGERAYRFQRVNESFAAGTGAGTVLQWLGNASGLQIGNIPTVLADITNTFDQGYVVHGPWQKEMDRLCKSIGYAWSIQNETLQVLRPGSSLGGAIPEIGPDSGLVGSPEMGTPEKKGQPALVHFQSLLMPTIPGAQVRLKSSRYNGLVRVKKCKFSGDTHGDAWFTDYWGVITNG